MDEKEQAQPHPQAHSPEGEGASHVAGGDDATRRDRWADPGYNGRTIHLRSDETGLEYVFKWPTSGHMSRYSREAMGGNVHKASRNLVMACLLFPAKAELETQFEEKPGLPIALANEINKKTGLTEDFTPKS